MTKNDLQSLLNFDRQHIWHPYTSLKNPLPVYAVQSADGVHINLATGERLVDGTSSWWCAIHGYNNPYLNTALQAQMQQMSHIMFGGLTHQPAVALAQKLIEITPQDLDKIFFCDSGSVSVEVAIKMAFQYWLGQGITEKCKLLTLRRGYHGDTFRAMAVCDPENGMHHVFNKVLAKNIFVDAPTTGYHDDLNPSDIEHLENIFKKHHHEVAAFILEPIVQNAGGMKMYPPAYLQKMSVLCNHYNVLLITDEIATGFGRTGTYFGCDHAGISPDILCLGKALTGGTMTLAATLCTTKVAETICRGELGVFMHGPTFMANPLACAVALASIELLEKNNWQQEIKRIESCLKQELTPLSNHKMVREVRVLGAIGVVECRQNIQVGNIQKFFVKNGVWIRPFRNLIYIMPPYISTNEHLTILCNAIKSSLKIETHFV